MHFVVFQVEKAVLLGRAAQGGLAEDHSKIITLITGERPCAATLPAAAPDSLILPLCLDNWGHVGALVPAAELSSGSLTAPPILASWAREEVLTPSALAVRGMAPRSLVLAAGSGSPSPFPSVPAGAGWPVFPRFRPWPRRDQPLPRRTKLSRSSACCLSCGKTQGGWRCGD